MIAARRNKLILLIIAAVTMLAPPTVSGLPQHGSGMLLYGEGSLANPTFRLYNPAAGNFGAEAGLPVASSTIRHITSQASPVRDEIISTVASTDGSLSVFRWDGAGWSLEWTAVIGDHAIMAFDVAYEQTSGDAVVMYTSNGASTNEIRYRVWDGASWTAATAYDAVRTSGTVLGIKLASSPDTDDIGLVWADSSLDISSNYWVGGLNSLQSEPVAPLTTNAQRFDKNGTINTYAFDVAFETVSKDMLVVWGEYQVSDLRYRTRSPGSGGSWGASATQPVFAETPTDVELIPDPVSNTIAYVNIEDGSANAEAGIWNGSSWQNIHTYVVESTPGKTKESGKNTSGAWLRSGSESRLVVVYKDNRSVGIDWLFYDKNIAQWSAIQPDYVDSPTTAAVDQSTVRMYPNPYNGNEAIIVLVDDNSDLFIKRVIFNGSAITFSGTEQSVSYEDNISSTTGMPVDFVYFNTVDPGVLSVDIVDGLGGTITNPGFSFPTIDSSFQCSQNTVTPTNIIIRVRNNTPYPSWSLSVAPTAGSSGLWQASESVYDFNDPSGCIDGADPDSAGGQLTVDPRAVNAQAQSGCSTEGISAGGAMSFREGIADSAQIASSSSLSNIDCYWDFSSSIEYSQALPSALSADQYTLNLTMTVVAN
jgi:hypothetical protein